MDGTFQIQMLGGFAIRLGDREAALSGRSKKLGLLLAFLILERERPVPVEEVAARADLELEQAQKIADILKAEFE